MASRAPVCCQTCGKSLGHLWDAYWGHVRTGKSEREAMDAIGIEPWRYCCRATLLTWVPKNGLNVSYNPPKGSTFTFRSSEMIAEDGSGETTRELICR